MKYIAYSVFILGLITITGCTRFLPIDPNNFTEISSNINVTYDSFKNQTTYEGPFLAGYLSYSPNGIMLRAWKDDNTGKIDYQIYAKAENWNQFRYFYSAYDSNGNRLNFRLISEEVIDYDRKNMFSEIFGIDITDEYLVKNQTRGISFKAYGKSGESIVFNITPDYIKAFLAVAKRQPSSDKKMLKSNKYHLLPVSDMQ